MGTTANPQKKVDEQVAAGSRPNLVGTPVGAPSTEQLVEVREGDTVWLRFNRPEHLNSFTVELYGDIKNALLRARYDDSIDSVVFTGTGRAFATGGDLKQGAAMMNDPIAFHRARDNFPWDAIRSCQKMTISAINGVCVAGGLVTALLSDISIAAESATFAVPEVRVGLSESYTPHLLFGRVSLAKLKYLVLTGKTISAHEAERLGMISEVAPDDQLYNRVDEVLDELRATSRAARVRYKEYIQQLMPEFVFEDLLQSFHDPAAMEYMRAFSARSRTRAANSLEGADG